MSGAFFKEYRVSLLTKIYLFPLVDTKKYCVTFEDALSSRKPWIDQSYMDQLDDLRDFPFFNTDNMPQMAQKTWMSMNQRHVR